MLVTAGATEAIASVVLALCEPGDEVVTFEPYYDSYAATIALAGATRRTSVLRFPDFAVDEASLRAAFSSRTRLVLLNTPHNPTGKVFTRAELELVASLAREHDAWVVTDEVYEHLVFDGAEHVPMATLPGMADRTITICSARQDLLGDRLEGRLALRARRGGRGCAHRQAVPHVRRVGPVPAGCGPRPGARRRGVAALRQSLQAKRDLLCSALEASGLRVARPSGTYFVIADAAPLGAVDGLEFARRAARDRRRRRGAGVRLPRRPGRGAHVGPVRLLQEGRGAPRGQPAPRRRGTPPPPDPIPPDPSSERPTPLE